MPVGLQIFNPQGQIIFDATDSAASLFGHFNTNSQQSGSFYDSRMVGRRLIYFAPQNDSLWGGPTVTVNPANGLISWQYSAIAEGDTPGEIPNDLVYFGGY